MTQNSDTLVKKAFGRALTLEEVEFLLRERARTSNDLKTTDSDSNGVFEISTIVSG
jgi:hypothetical protein